MGRLSAGLDIQGGRLVCLCKGAGCRQRREGCVQEGTLVYGVSGGAHAADTVAEVGLDYCAMAMSIANIGWWGVVILALLLLAQSLQGEINMPMNIQKRYNDLN